MTKDNIESFIVALFTIKGHKKPCNLVKIVKSNDSWIAIEPHDIMKNGNLARAKFLNAFKIQDQQIMCVTSYEVILLNKDLEVTEIKPVFGKKIGFI